MTERFKTFKFSDLRRSRTKRTPYTIQNVRQLVREEIHKILEGEFCTSKEQLCIKGSRGENGRKGSPGSPGMPEKRDHAANVDCKELWEITVHKVLSVGKGIAAPRDLWVSQG